MKTKWLVVFILSFAFKHMMLIAQQTYPYFDSLTYRLFNQNKWDSLIIYGQQAIDKGIDYYYLRMRMGIAYYSIKKYSKGIEHFLKAKEYNSNEIVKKYIYYSYLYSGQNREAYYFTKQMNETTLKTLNLTQPHFIDLIGITINCSKYKGWETIKTENTTPPYPNNYILEKEITGPFNSYDINTSINLSKKWSWYQQFSYFKVNSYQQLYFDNTIKHENDFYLFEKHYYTAFNHWIKNKSLCFFTHLFLLNANKFKYNYLNAEFAPLPFPPTTFNYNINLINYRLFNYVLGIGRKHYLSNSIFSYTLNFAKIINNNVITGGLEYSYRFNNQLFYEKITALASANISHKSLNAYIEQDLGIFFSKKIELNIVFDVGKIQNITNFYGNIVYNTPYTINTKIFPQIIISINRNLFINAAYIYQNNSFTNTFVGFDGYDSQGFAKFSNYYKKYKFNNQIISGGILWKF